jgi:hypothetical protein
MHKQSKHLLNATFSHGANRSKNLDGLEQNFFFWSSGKDSDPSMEVVRE